MAWILLFAAGLLEIVWAYTMKLSQGFTRGGPTAVTLLAMLASLQFFTPHSARLHRRSHPWRGPSLPRMSS